VFCKLGFAYGPKSVWCGEDGAFTCPVSQLSMGGHVYIII